MRCHIFRSQGVQYKRIILSLDVYSLLAMSWALGGQKYANYQCRESPFLTFVEKYYTWIEEQDQ